MVIYFLIFGIVCTPLKMHRAMKTTWHSPDYISLVAVDVVKRIIIKNPHRIINSWFAGINS